MNENELQNQEQNQNQALVEDQNPNDQEDLGNGGAQMQPMEEGENGEGPEEEQEEDPEEEQEEKEEQDENPPDENPHGPGENLVGDDVNQEIALVAAEAGMNNDDQEEEGDPDRAFDTLDDLKKLAGESNDANGQSDDKDSSERAIQDRKAVMQLRKGNLYKAVIFARMLENGENPAGEERALEASNPAAAGGRFNRFVNSSKLDKAGKVLKLTNAASGLVGMYNSEYKSSKLSTLISRATDVITLVNSIRGIIKKLRDFKKNATSPKKKAFAVIGLIADFGMAVSKGAAIAQRVFSRNGLGGLASVMGYLSSFSGAVGQIAALTNVSNSLKELVQSTAPIKKAQKEEEANVLAVLNKYEIKTETASAAEPGQAQQGQAEPGQAQQGQAQPGQAQQGKEKSEPKKRRLGKKKALQEKVLQALERPDINKEDKAVLASYLGRARILSKRKVTIANVATGLITATLGLGATFSKSAASHSGGNTQINAVKSATAFGGMTNISMLGSAIGMHIAGKKVRPDEKETGLIKEGLYGALHNLGSDDEYGLRKIAATLEPKEPAQEDLQKAENAVKKYETASKQFQGSGVNYAKLFTATDTEAFKNSLVASL